MDKRKQALPTAWLIDCMRPWVGRTLLCLGHSGMRRPSCACPLGPVVRGQGGALTCGGVRLGRPLDGVARGQRGELERELLQVEAIVGGVVQLNRLQDAHLRAERGARVECDVIIFL